MCSLFYCQCICISIWRLFNILILFSSFSNQGRVGWEGRPLVTAGKENITFCYLALKQEVKWCSIFLDKHTEVFLVWWYCTISNVSRDNLSAWTKPFQNFSPGNERQNTSTLHEMLVLIHSKEKVDVKTYLWQIVWLLSLVDETQYFPIRIRTCHQLVT